MFSSATMRIFAIALIMSSPAMSLTMSSNSRRDEVASVDEAQSVAIGSSTLSPISDDQSLIVVDDGSSFFQRQGEKNQQVSSLSAADFVQQDMDPELINVDDSPSFFQLQGQAEAQEQESSLSAADIVQQDMDPELINVDKTPSFFETQSQVQPTEQPATPVYVPTTPIYSVQKPEKSDIDELIQQMGLDLNYPERELERVKAALSQLEFHKARIDLELAMESDPAHIAQLQDDGAATDKKIAAMKALELMVQAKCTKKYHHAVVDSGTVLRPKEQDQVAQAQAQPAEDQSSIIENLEIQAQEIEEEVSEMIEKKFEEQDSRRSLSTSPIALVVLAVLVMSALLVAARFLCLGSCLGYCRRSQAASEHYDQFTDQGSAELRDSIRRERNRSVRTMVQDRKDLSVKGAPAAFMSVQPPTDDAVAAAAAASGFDEQPSQTIAPAQSGTVGSNMLLV